MATKTPIKAAKTTEQDTPNTESLQPIAGAETFLKQNFPHNKGETVQVQKIFSNGYRVNVRRPTNTDLSGLTMYPIVNSKFVYVDTLNDGSPTIRYAPRQ